MKLSSKAKLSERANKIIDAYQAVTTRVFDLQKQGKITGGCLLVYTWCDNYYYKELSKVMYTHSAAYRHTTKSELSLLVRLYEKDYLQVGLFACQIIF